MELKLYKYLRSIALPEEVDFSDPANQRKLEAGDKTLGLNETALSNINSDLKRYNAYRHTQNEAPIQLRYYQILALYFTELYFLKSSEPDWLFSTENLAYWMATGSGKTIIMHLNILQYIRNQKHGRELELIVTTPGVNLIGQHERELTPFVAWLNQQPKTIRTNMLIGTTSALLKKPDDYFAAPDAKSYRRLILVDEAHIGLGGSKTTDGAFLELRKRLNIKNSFLFEYSATFHNLNSKLERQYEKAIVFDYNYNLFYRDGYGKDYYFQQIGDDVLQGDTKDNLHHNMSIITEKLKVWEQMDYAIIKNLFNAAQFPDKPLIAFMGNTVNSKASKDINKDDEVSDIAEIVRFLANLTEEEKEQYAPLFNYEYQGKLTLTRNTTADDEILLSYGTGDYWGIVNVGSGAKFINELPFENVVKKSSEQLVISDLDKYLFQNIDEKESPINVLIGSRKFAEGWNCFRVSVIGLINLGSSKGNKIIQIFGRGVRLHGLENNGKRKYPSHTEDYFALRNLPNKEEGQVRMLETMCVFSLKKSYLETFTKAVNQELEVTYSFEIEVNPSIIPLNGGTQITFEEYREKLPVFKLSKIEIEQKKVILSDTGLMEFEYYQNGELKQKSLSKASFKLDYRVDKKETGTDIKGELSNHYRSLKPFIRQTQFSELIQDLSEEYGIQIYGKVNSEVQPLQFENLLSFAESILYKSSLNPTDIDFFENTILRVSEDLFKKIRNKINWQINSSNYVFDEKLNQSDGSEKGDFIEKYYLVKTFPATYEVRGKTKFYKPAEIQQKIDSFRLMLQKVEERLTVSPIGNHIYEPLLDTPLPRRSYDDNIQHEQDLKISPDKLNSGERKFIQDTAAYFEAHRDKFQDYEIYLMRNIESLKSIGIYLDADEQVFYPDFILWMIHEEKIYITFIDPKGQMGMIDPSALLENEKVRIADKVNNSTLPNLEKELTQVYGKKVILNSFLLLRDTSGMGKYKPLDWVKKNMVSKNILRLNWHQTNEFGFEVTSKELPEGKSYLDWMVNSIEGL